jgi:polar amino acid transport system substrate-binding protein
MKTHRVPAFLVLLLVLALVLGACQPAAPATTAAQPTATAETTFDRVKREGVVRVGFANEKPFAYAQPDGTLAGEAPDIARAIFTNLGIKQMEGVLTEFGSLIPGLQANRFDVITAGMYIKPERCEQVLFANPEYKIGSGLLVKAGNPLNLHSYEDIAANSKVKIGTGAGYFEADYLAGVGVKEDQIVLFPDDASGVAGVQAGQIDAYTATSMAILTLLTNAKDPQLEMVAPFTDPVINGKPVTGYAGTAFRKSDAALRDAFNAELEKLKASGQLLEILKANGFGEANLPGDVTAEQACKP